MKFVHHDLGRLSRGEIVEVSLSGSAANVRLLDSLNFGRYRSGKDHKCEGGLVKRSPVQLKIPRTSHWHVAVDLVGLKGNVRSSACVLPKPLPALRSVSTSSMPSLVETLPAGAVRDIPSTQEKTYDIFISHAWEDKEAFVRPLAHALVEEGLEVWYDEFTLRIGDSLRRSIDKGITASRFGLVVLSDDFFKKKWSNYELDGLVTKSGTDEQIILPVWHNITKDDVMAYSPSLADKVARSTADFSVEEIADEVADFIRERTH